MKEPLLIGPDSVDNVGLPEIYSSLDQLTETLSFLLEEWQNANNLLNSLGFPATFKDEFNDNVFMTLEERIRRAVEHGHENS